MYEVSSSTQNCAQIEEIVAPSKSAYSLTESMFQNRKRLFEIIDITKSNDCNVTKLTLLLLSLLVLCCTYELRNEK